MFQDVITDIEVHGKILKLLLSICKALAEDDLIDDDNQAMKRVECIETVWHGVWLRTLEWELGCPGYLIFSARIPLLCTGLGIHPNSFQKKYQDFPASIRAVPSCFVFSPK